MTDPSQRPAAEGIAPGHFSPSPVEAGHTAPCPRRIRAMHGDKWALDSSEVTYYWEHPYYPQYLVPMADINLDVVPDTALRTVDGTRADLRLVTWKAMDRWFEEDEEVFVHPRSPYARADAIRSSRRVRLHLGDAVLADASGCVIVFETGLPPRYYLDKTTIDWSLLSPSDTVSECPYKGTTSQYWNVVVNGQTSADLAWGYDFPAQAVAPIAGLVAFYDEKLRLTLDHHLGGDPAIPRS